MNFLPESVTRLGGRTLLKLKAGSPTILVVAGVVGLGATAIVAAKATRKIDPILEEHKQARADIGYSVTTASTLERRKELLALYTNTGFELGKLYGPALFIGTTSAISVLGGHHILRARQIATMAAYSGLLDQFRSYRGRVAQTLGKDVERGIYEGAHGEWQENPDMAGDKALVPKFEPDETGAYLRPWFEETNPNFNVLDARLNYLFLKGVQSHMNQRLRINGHVMLNDVLDSLHLPRCPEGAIVGWVWEGDGDNYIDLGFMTSIDPDSVEFRNAVGRATPVRLNFNIDGIVYHLISKKNKFR